MNSVETIMAIIVMIAIGYLLRKRGILDSEDSQTLNKIVINLSIPSLIFLAMYTADLSDIHILVLIPFICLLLGTISGIIGYLFAKAKGYSYKTRWSIIITTAMVNSGFLGYPVILGVFGAQGLIRAIFYDMGSIILFIGFGILFMMIFKSKSSDIIKKTFLFPPLWGVLFGIIFNLLNIEIGFFENIIDYLSGAAIPLIMISLGLSLQARDIKGYIDVASFVSFIRLIFAPLMALVIVYLIGIDGLERSVIIVEAAMPSAMLSLVLAINYDLDVNAVAASIFLTTVLSMITIPLLIIFL
ncbi:MAG: AEC family transporter [Methanobacteriaceae archaeon]|nr:AEC family transporter [Methanobacteriaceae archaeon]